MAKSCESFAQQPGGDSKGSHARSRNLQKKLAQIAALEDSAKQGLELSAEQYAKVSRRAAVEVELRQLQAEEEVVLDSQQEEEPDRHMRPDQSGIEHVAREHSSRRAEAQLLPKDISVLEEAAADAAAPTEIHECDTTCSPHALRERLHSERWEDDPVAVEDVAPTSSAVPAAQAEVELLEDVKPFGTSSKGSERLSRLLRATSELSREAFETDVIEGVSRKGKWKLTLLAQIEGQDEKASNPWGGLLGFIAYKPKPQVQCISIAKLAVVPEHRGRGHGHKIVQWMIAFARKQPNITYLSLTSLPKAVKFYKQIGFRQVDVDLSKFDNAPQEEEFDYVEGQVYMEYRCKGRNSQRKRR